MSSPKKLRAFWFKLDVYGTAVDVVCGGSHLERERYVRKHINRKHKMDRDADYAGRLICNQNHLTILLERWHPTPYDLATLAHECLHATFWIMGYHGMKHGKKTEEAYCLLHDALFQRCIEGLAVAKGARKKQ